MAERNAVQALQAVLANMRHTASKRSTPDQSPTSSATPNTPSSSPSSSPNSPASSPATRAKALFGRTRSTLLKKDSATSLKSPPSEPEYTNNNQPYFDTAPKHPTTPFELLRKNNPERRKGKKTSVTSLKSIISEPAMSPPDAQCYGTVLARPRNPSPVSLEWRQRLLEGHVAYGEQTELFAPSGIESIFPQPPPRDAVEPSTGAEEFDGDQSIIHRGDAPSAPPSPSGRLSITTHDFISEAQMVMAHLRAGTMPQMEELDEDEDYKLAESLDGSSFSPSVTSSDEYRRQSEDLTEQIYGGADEYQVAESPTGPFSPELEPSQQYSEPDDRITEALLGGHVDDDQVAESQEGPFSPDIEALQQYSQPADKITELIHRGEDDSQVAESQQGPFSLEYGPSEQYGQPADRITEALLGGHAADDAVAESQIGPCSPTDAVEPSEQYSQSAGDLTEQIYDGDYLTDERVAEGHFGPFSPSDAADPSEMDNLSAEGFSEYIPGGNVAGNRVAESHIGPFSPTAAAAPSAEYTHQSAEGFTKEMYGGEYHQGTEDQQPLEGITELLYGSQLPQPSLRDDTDPNKIQDLPVITIPRVRPMERPYGEEPEEFSLRDDTDPNKIQDLPVITMPRVRPMERPYEEELAEFSLRDDTDPNKIQDLPVITIPRVRPTAQEQSLRRQTLMRRFTASAYNADAYEQSELSMVATLPGDRMLSLSMSVSRPIQNRYESGTIIDMDTTPPWSELSDFTIDQIDEDRPSERALAQRLASYAAAEVNDRYATATNELVKALTDVVGAKLFWNDVDELELQNQSLASLYGLEGFCSAVTTLNVNGNPLTQLQGAPRTTRTLWAQSCKLTSLTTWSHLRNLQHLFIENNELDNLSGLSRLVHLRDLRASGNKITSLDGLQGLCGLQMLDLSNNRLEILDFKGYGLFGLEKLNVRDNAITRVLNLSKLIALTELHLSSNPLEKSPSLAGNAPQLRKLSLQDCHLKELVVGALTGITHLWADGNSLTDIRGIEHLKKLEMLSMRRQKLPAYKAVNLLSHRVEARYVRLDGNPLPTLPLKHNYLRMDTLSLNSCGIQELPKDFGLRLPNLRRLELDNNMLKEKDLAVLGNMERLEQLSVRENRFGRMRKTVEELTKIHGLRMLDIEGNPFNKGFYGGMGELEEWALRKRAYEVFLLEKCPKIINIGLLDGAERVELAERLRELGVLF